MSGYRSHPYVANSDLGGLEAEMYGLEKPSNIQEIYDFGNLVDAKLTEPNLIDYSNRSIWLNDNWQEVQPLQWRQSEAMVKSMKLDPVIAILLANMIGQYEFYKTINIEYDGFLFSIAAKCKFDGLNKKFKIAVDYKTTGCATEKAFIQSIEHFNYDRQAAWYMDISAIDKFWFIGVSKKNNKVFKYAVQRGDSTYLSGKRKYEYLAYQWHIMFDNFK